MPTSFDIFQSLRFIPTLNWNDPVHVTLKLWCHWLTGSENITDTAYK